LSVSANGVASNSARPNTINFPAGSTSGTVTGTSITVPNTSTPIEIVSDAYYQNGLISTSVTI
jgi:hypothetical protein